ncbi:MAG: hypothetical protein P4L53_03690 [Candidatus Obscuribacterales bacterium]|nr:hypothetical protein [Candidatus Obscuribacterales bacterium]
MIDLALNIYAFWFLLSMGLLLAALFGTIGFFSIRAIRRRIRTRLWTPAIGDRVSCRHIRVQGTIETIHGARLLVGFYDDNNQAKNYLDTDRSKLFFDFRPAPRRSVY